MPLTDIHLKSNYKFELEPISHIKTIYISEAIAFSMLLIAYINFMNISTASASIQKIGIRDLNVSVKFYFAIRAFNENGVSKVSEVKGGI